MAKRAASGPAEPPDRVEELEPQTSYDRVPYTSHPYRQSHPDHLGVVASLFGMSPAPPERSRVLELGCASGGNLVPMATRHPGSEFVGIDLSARQVADGREIIRKIGATNVELRHQSILDVGADLGKFDYILCHGVYSWVPPEVQDRILAICAEQLNDNGIAYVSYNCYPGWHLRDMIRHMMFYHAAQFDDPATKIRQSRALLRFLHDSVPAKNNPYSAVLKREMDLLKRQADCYVFHEHLEEVNIPVYFYAFMDSAVKHGLQYLGESDIGTMLARGFSDKVRKTLERVAGNMIRREQYMDFLRNRQFRQTLLCRREAKPNWNVTSEGMTRFRVRLSSEPLFRGERGNANVDLLSEAKLPIRARGGQVAYLGRPISKAALRVLQESLPASVPFDELFGKAAGKLGQGGDGPTAAERGALRTHLAADLTQAFTTGIVTLHSFEPAFAAMMPERPRMAPLAALQAERDGTVVTPWHALVRLGIVARKLAAILDGQLDRKALAARVRDWIDTGELDLSKLPPPHAGAEEYTEVALRNLLRLGVLEA
jgi:hypothetical protein